MKAVRHIVDDAKVKDEPAPTVSGVKAAAEEPDKVIAKIDEQATFLGPVLEAMLRDSRGQSHWGLND